ncbi:MAG TPA: diacylglycerol kinase family protein [Gemmatimonadales bacterium]|nr:diacylglycerol kinase family protein [Gemmatimonadales bacterium]
MRVLLIMNPAAARTEAVAVQAVLRTLRQGGWTVELQATGGPGDARRFAEEARRQRMDAVCVFGGDGTTMQAAAALVGTEVLLGVIPGGTGNLLAGNLRIPTHPVRAARALLRATPRPLDLGRMERDDGTHYFAVACGCGYDARVMAETRTEDKQRWGFAAYVATTLRLMPELRSVEHLITADGVEYEAHGALVLVANCGEIIPPYVKLRRGITPDDGVLDLVVVRADSFTESLAAIWELLHEPRRAGRRDGGYVGYARGAEITVTTTPPRPVQLDGEPGGETPFTARVVPAAVRVLTPPRHR